MRAKLHAIIQKNNLKQMLLDTAFILFTLSLLIRFIIILLPTLEYEGWWLSEFLINYQNGFVRRGLTGEILFFFARNFNINLELTIKIVCLISIVFVCAFFIKAFLKRGYSLYILPLCFFLGGNIIANPIRKDFLFICFFISILWIYSKANLSMSIKIIILNILAVFIILSHEVFAFFALPILFLLFFNQKKEKGFLQSIILSFTLLAPSVLAFLSTIYFHGNSETAQIIWDSWFPFINQETSQIGVSVKALGWSSSEAFKYHFKLNFLYIDNYILSIWVWIITFPIIYYIATNALFVFKKTKTIFTYKDKRILSSILVFQLLCLLPLLIILSCDYIRIIFYWITSSFVIFLLIPKIEIEKLFPTAFVRIINHIDNFLKYLIRPSKTILIVLMMVIGISPFYCLFEQALRTTMLYNILLLLSQPLIYLKDFLLT
jgi:hypothetical protein